MNTHEIEKLNATMGTKKKKLEKRPPRIKPGKEVPDYATRENAKLLAKNITDFWAEKGFPDVVMKAVPLPGCSSYHAVRQISGPPIATLDTSPPAKTGPRRAKY